MNAAERMREWRKNNKERDYQNGRALKLSSRYGLTVEDWDKLYLQQNGRCAICPATDNLVVDHCHTTNTVRGLLCKSCNLAIGLMKDDDRRLELAAKYLTT